MPPARRVPSVSLRRLGKEIEQLRAQRSLSRVQVAERTSVSKATQIRLENGQSKPQTRTLVALLDFYGVGEPRRSALMQLATSTDVPDWLGPIHGNLNDQYAIYIALEAKASIVRNVEPLVVPGLLQTREYAEAVIPGVWPAATEGQRAQHLQARMERQKRLAPHENPLRLVALIGAAALQQNVGGPSVMAEQLRHLRTMIDRQHIDLRVLPFGADAHPGLLGGFVTLDLPDQPSVAYVDSPAGARFLEAEADLRHYADLFDRIHAVALSPGRSRDAIEAALHALPIKEIPA